MGDYEQTEKRMSPAAHHLPPGTVLKGRYRIERVLGEGGFGITYMGMDLRLELKAAIKEYFPIDKANRIASVSLAVSGSAGAGYRENIKEFLKEAHTMAKLEKQSAIVKVRDFFEENNTAYIVMEYVDGITLKEVVRKKGGRIPADELLPMVEPLFDALESMHKEGLVHRDISPENLMLENGKIRLLDFSSARETNEGEATLTIILKHGYAPVEQYQSKGQGPRTDVYALASTMYYCLTGEKPPSAMDRLVEDKLIPPGELGAELTRQQERALLYGMGIRPLNRFQSVREMHDAIYQAADRKTPDRHPEREKKRRIQLKAAICCAVILVFAVMPFIFLEIGQKENTQDDKSLKNETNSKTPAGEGIQEELLYRDELTVNRESFARGKIYDGNDEKEFRELLKGSSPVILASDMTVPDTEKLLIHVPLMVCEDVSFTCFSPIEISENGMVYTEGTFYSDEFLYVRTGGILAVEAKGTIVNQGCCLVEKRNGLQIAPGAGTDGFLTDENSERCVVTAEEERFAGAMHITDEKGLKRAIEESVPGIIDENLTITKRLALTAPLLIGENAAVRTTGEGSLDTSGCMLINRGEIFGTYHASSGEQNKNVTVNYGNLDAAVHLGEGMLINSGTMNFQVGKALGGLDLYNLGVWSYEAREPYLDISRSRIYNYSEFSMKAGTDSSLNMLNGTVFRNRGTVRIDERISFNNYGNLFNGGTILLEKDTAVFNNTGLVEFTNPQAAFDCNVGTVMNEGMIVNRTGKNVTSPFFGNIITFFPNGDAKGVRQAAKEDEFLESLADESCQTIILKSGTDIVVHDGITVSKGLVIEKGASLQADGLALSGENAFLYLKGKIDLNGRQLFMEDMASVCLFDEDDNSGIFHADIDIENGAHLLDTGGVLGRSDGLKLKTSGGEVSLTGDTSFTNAKLDLGAGEFIANHSLSLYGCEVILDGYISVYCPNVFLADSDTRIEITKNGYFHIGGWEWQKRTIAGTVENHGTLSIMVAGPVKVSGTIDNYGILECGDSSMVNVTGCFNNEGSVRANQSKNAGIYAKEGGKVTGSTDYENME